MFLPKALLSSRLRSLLHSPSQLLPPSRSILYLNLLSNPCTRRCPPLPSRSATSLAQIFAGGRSPKPRALPSSVHTKPKSVPSGVTPPKSDAPSGKEEKLAPWRTSSRFRPMEEKGFPEELPPEVEALVNRLQTVGYLKEANFSKGAPLDAKEIPPNLYSRHFLKSAAEKFGQDHQEIAKWLSGSDLKKVALFGCPSVERRTVFAAKRLRSFFKIQEDVVCRGCKLKSSCNFVNQRAGRVEKVILLDTMRILSLYGLDAVPVQLHIPDELKSSVNKLLREVINLSA